MKKFLFALACLFTVATTIHAQSWSFDESSDSKKNWFGIDLGVGSMKDYEGTGVDLGIRYQHNYGQYVAWNIFNLKAMANTKDFGATVTPQLMTGLKGISPSFFKEMTGFVGFKGGYGYNIDGEDGGFCYEIELGVNLTRNIFIGYAYNNQKIGEGNVKYSAFRIGFNL